MHPCLTLATLLPILALAGCNSKTGTIQSEGQGPIVDSQRGGLAMMELLVTDTTQLALDRLRADLAPSQYLVFVMMPLQNSTSEELRDLREMIEGTVRTHLFQAELVDVLSNDLVDAGLGAVGVSKSDWNQLYLEGTRQAFLDAVGSGATRPTHFLKLEITGGSSSAGRVEDRRYTLAIEINDAVDGRAVLREQTTQLKQYTR